LTPCCEDEVQKSTQALKSAKCPENTFDSNTKWTRILPFGILHGIFIKAPINAEVDIGQAAVCLR
jgi:hypothetical protein